MTKRFIIIEGTNSYHEYAADLNVVFVTDNEEDAIAYASNESYLVIDTVENRCGEVSTTYETICDKPDEPYNPYTTSHKTRRVEVFVWTDFEEDTTS